MRDSSTQPKCIHHKQRNSLVPICVVLSSKETIPSISLYFKSVQAFFWGVTINNGSIVISISVFQPMRVPPLAWLDLLISIHVESGDVTNRGLEAGDSNLGLQAILSKWPRFTNPQFQRIDNKNNGVFVEWGYHVCKTLSGHATREF